MTPTMKTFKRLFSFLVSLMPATKNDINKLMATLADLNTSIAAVSAKADSLIAKAGTPSDVLSPANQALVDSASAGVAALDAKVTAALSS